MEYKKNKVSSNKNLTADERDNLKNLLKFTVDWLYAPVDEDFENTLYFMNEDLNQNFKYYLNKNFSDKSKYGIRLKKSISSINEI